MQVDHTLSLMMLVPVVAARSTAPTSRKVDVVLGRVSLVYTATSPLGLPHGQDLRVLLALTTNASDDGHVRLSMPALLREADLGAGGRQHAVVFAALDRLTSVTYTVQNAPKALGLPSEFRLILWAGLAPDGQLHAELSPDLAAQLCAARARPTRRNVPNIPSNALALHGLLETLRRQPGMFEGGQWHLPVAATCELLGLPGRGDNARRSLLTMLAALKTTGHVSQVRRDQDHMIITDAGPDAELIKLLTREGLSRTSATTFARTLGDLVPSCLERAREIRHDSEQRGKPVNNWTKLLAKVLHYPDQFDVRSQPPALRPITPKPMDMGPLIMSPELAITAPASEADAVIRLLKGVARKKLTDAELAALRLRVENGLEDAAEMSQRISQAMHASQLPEFLRELRSRLQAA